MNAPLLEAAIESRAHRRQMVRATTVPDRAPYPLRMILILSIISWTSVAFAVGLATSG